MNLTNMTAQQKIKAFLLTEAFSDPGYELPALTAENIDLVWDDFKGNDVDYLLSDPINEFRCSGIDTGLKCERSRHYETKSVARQMPDGSWVGWTYWYGGGKHSDPKAFDWLGSAYLVNVTEKQEVVKVRTFEAASV